MVPSVPLSVTGSAPRPQSDRLFARLTDASLPPSEAGAAGILPADEPAMAHPVPAPPVFTASLSPGFESGFSVKLRAQASDAASRSGTAAFPRPAAADLAPVEPRVSGIEGLLQRGREWDELELRFLPETRTLWCDMRPKGPPSFTPGLLSQLISLRRGIQQVFAQQRPQQESSVRFFVGGSLLPGIYNLGGDLAAFARMIRARDREGLRLYAHDCVDVGYHMATGFRTPVITIGLVKGDALGGGFEGALSFHVLVAEKRARFGLPEVMFNLFPGMGAYSFLMRRVGAPMAERMILSGRIYTAEELHALGIVDVLAEDGEGEQAVRDYLQSTARKHAAHRAIYEIRQRVNPVSLQELRDVTDIWVDTALGLEESDLRRMEKLTQAQRRRIAARDVPAA
jgi:DSF synthase